jgi:hypothetical protein
VLALGLVEKFERGEVFVRTGLAMNHTVHDLLSLRNPAFAGRTFILTWQLQYCVNYFV